LTIICSWVLLVFGRAHFRRDSIMFAHVFAVLCGSIITVSAEVVYF
jgi:hypothetical protein